MAILVIAEHDNESIRASTFNTVTAAAALGGEIHVLVVGYCAAAAASAAAGIDGVAKVLHADAQHYEDQGVENVAALIAANAAAYSHLLAPATSFGKNLMPRVAALLDVAQLSEIVEVESADTFVRPIYAGNALATVKSRDVIKVITVRTTAFAAAGVGATAAVEALAATPDLALSQVVSRLLVKSKRPELAAAKIVVSGGRGLGSGENYRTLLEPLADALGAALGASRAAVDAGFVPNDYQVGQTGKIVAPQLYFAVGISGAIQHLAGMKDSKVIVAINKDPDAPIFSVADFGVVGDLFELVPQLTAALHGSGSAFGAEAMVDSHGN
jgi:electron transfer flavoprotein alpha subunit